MEGLDGRPSLEISEHQKGLHKSGSLTNLASFAFDCMSLTSGGLGAPNMENVALTQMSFNDATDKTLKDQRKEVDGSKPDMKLCSSVLQSIQEDHFHEQANYEVQSILFPEYRETLTTVKGLCISRSSSSGKSSSYSPLRQSVTFTNTKRGNRQTETPSIAGADLTTHQLAAQGDSLMLMERLEQSTDVDELDEQKYTPLMWACANDQRDVVKHLIQAGANQKLCGQDGETALSFAVIAGSVDIVHTLCKAGADVNAYDWNGGTPLMYAVHGDHAQCAEELLKYGADMTQENESSNTPYSLAIALGNVKVLTVLEDHLLLLLQNSCTKI